MDIDPYISNWVMEFLLKQTLTDQTLNSLLLTLPLPNNNSNLKKTLLLKKLESDVSRNSISETTLELLDHIGEIETQQATVTVSESMKLAYCAVAVECTVKHLVSEDDWENSGRFKFFEAVRKVWRGKIGGMEEVWRDNGLGSDELWEWKDNIEAAVWDDSVCANVVKKSKLVDVVGAVGSYLREEMEKMGPSFLELVAEKVEDDKVVKEILEVGIVDVVAEKNSNSSGVGRGTECPDDSDRVEMRKEKIYPRNKHLRGAKITDPDDEMPVGTSYGNYNLPRSAEANKVREALESSSVDLHAAVKDPLPDALHLAEEIAGIAKNKDIDPLEENLIETNIFIVDTAGVIHVTGCNASNVLPISSFMERNSSAHTYEWDESPCGSQEGSRNDRVRPMLPSPRKTRVSPLKKYEFKDLKARRKRLRWSNLEEDTLRAGVQKYGRGSWKMILMAYPDIFEDRTDVDLKDKWRNMTRY